MIQIGRVKHIFSDSIGPNGPSWEKVDRRGCGSLGGSIDLAHHKNRFATSASFEPRQEGKLEPQVKGPLTQGQFPASHQEV
jgi:hypothetical protein